MEVCSLHLQPFGMSWKVLKGLHDDYVFDSLGRSLTIISSVWRISASSIREAIAGKPNVLL